MKTVEKLATAAGTLEEEACDQPKNTDVNTEYPPRSNDETQDEEAHHQSYRNH
jgi:hypothetical protein